MLLVTAYYSIPSKQPSSFYYEHIRRFFKYIKIPVLFFTDDENYNILKKIAGTNIEFYIQEFETLDIFNHYPIEFWKSHIAKDPQNIYHTWQLGALWANKSLFVKKASIINPNYDWYMWVDSGSIRSDSWQTLLETFGTRSLPITPGVYKQLLKPIPQKHFFEFPDIYVAGSHILFHKTYIDNYNFAYLSVLDNYNKHNISVIMDQYIMATMSLRYSFVKTILYNPEIKAIDKWFFFFCLF